MDTSAEHRTLEELSAGLATIQDSPKDSSTLAAIFLRPAEDARKAVTTAELTVEGGIDGDRWAIDHWQKLPDGSPDPISQVSVMNLRVLELISSDQQAMGLAGDNLIVDLNLSEENFPAGSKIQVGNEVVLEFTSQAHTGCRKFSLRYGQVAKDFINGPTGKPLNLRGRYLRIVKGGTVHLGDQVIKV